MSAFDPRPGARATLRPAGTRHGPVVKVLTIDRAANRALVETEDRARLNVKAEHLTFPPKGDDPE